MDISTHSLNTLFAQLGLPDDALSIENFIVIHNPLPEHVPLHEAVFWSPAQAAFLREQIRGDADWAIVVDELNIRLRAVATPCHPESHPDSATAPESP